MVRPRWTSPLFHLTLRQHLKHDKLLVIHNKCHHQKLKANFTLCLDAIYVNYCSAILYCEAPLAKIDHS